MYNRLMAFIVGNQVLFDVQHGFRANKSTEIALQCFVKSIQEALEDKMNPTGIFLDVTKAYDVLNYTIGLSKLNSYGIRNVVNLWFELYLSHRKQCEEINNTKIGKRSSTIREFEHGVP
jgi:hypothetical protein